MQIKNVKKEKNVNLFGPESLNSIITPSSSISELIRAAFLENKLDEVQNILVDRERQMRVEMENLVKDRDEIQKKFIVLETKMGSMHMEKLQLQEKLQRKETECDELKEKNIRLCEDLKLSSERAESAEKNYAEFCVAQSNISKEKDKMISKLNKEVNELVRKNLEHERMEGIHTEQFKSWDMRLTKLAKDVKELKEENLVAVEIIKELRSKKLKADKTIEELRSKNLEASQVLEQLRSQESKASKAAQFHKSMLEKLKPRIVQLEEEMTGIFQRPVNDFDKVVRDGEMPACAAEEQEMNFPNSEGEKEFSDNGNVRAGKRGNVGDMFITSQRMLSACNFHNGSPKGDGGENLFKSSCCKEDAANGVPSSGAAECNNGMPQSRTNEIKGQQGSGDSNGTPSKKVTSSPRAADIIIQISDSDDETPPAPNTFSNVDDKETNFIQNPSSFANNRQNGTESVSLGNWRPKRKRMDGGDDDISMNGQKEAKTHSMKFDGFSIGCCTDLEFDTASRRWIFGADMLKAFEKDPNVCMSAVCALYRRKVSDEKSGDESGSSSCSFGHFDAMSGPALAEYLIDGDSKLRLKKSVSEVKTEKPDVLKQCKDLASIYYEKLFQIYYRKEDPFFC